MKSKGECISKKGREDRRRVRDEQCREEKVSEKNNRDEPKERTKQSKRKAKQVEGLNGE